MVYVMVVCDVCEEAYVVGVKDIEYKDLDDDTMTQIYDLFMDRHMMKHADEMIEEVMSSDD